jgi:hypothetical protein
MILERVVRETHGGFGGYGCMYVCSEKVRW